MRRIQHTEKRNHFGTHRKCNASTYYRLHQHIIYTKHYKAVVGVFPAMTTNFVIYLIFHGGKEEEKLH